MRIRKIINVSIIVAVAGAWLTMTFFGSGALSETGLRNLRFFTIQSNLFAALAAAVWLAVSGGSEGSRRAEPLPASAGPAGGNRRDHISFGHRVYSPGQRSGGDTDDAVRSRVPSEQLHQRHRGVARYQRLVPVPQMGISGRHGHFHDHLCHHMADRAADEKVQCGAQTQDRVNCLGRRT